MVSVQSLHPGAVTSNLNNFKKDPTCCTPDECARGALADLPTEPAVCGAFIHTAIFRPLLPVLRALSPLNGPAPDAITKDRDVVMEPYVDKE